MPEKTEEKKVEKEVQQLVVDKLPQQDVRSFIGENGVEYHLLTTEEAITEILETVRKISKSVA